MASARIAVLVALLSVVTMCLTGCSVGCYIDLDVGDGRVCRGSVSGISDACCQAMDERKWSELLFPTTCTNQELDAIGYVPCGYPAAAATHRSVVADVTRLKAKAQQEK